jgi:hypothetical protein
MAAGNARRLGDVDHRPDHPFGPGHEGGSCRPTRCLTDMVVDVYSGIAAGTGVAQPGRVPRCCSAPAPPWCARPCSPRSAMSPTRPGAPAPWGVYRLWRRRLGAGRRARRRIRHPYRRRGRRRLTAAAGALVAVRMYETH